jgi:3D (Asp-Asp-Asp) domain-containing protein
MRQIKIHPKIWTHVQKMYRHYYPNNFKDVFISLLGIEEKDANLSIFSKLNFEEGLIVIKDLLENYEVKHPDNWNYFGDYVRNWRPQLLEYLHDNGIIYNEIEKNFSIASGKPIPLVVTKQSSEPAQNSIPEQRPTQNQVIEKENSVYKYDVALSFAGEDRKIVEEIATELKKNDISVFYDKFQKADLWGKKLSQYFKETYGENTRFVIVFISEHYSLKDWTDFELTIAREEAKTRKSEFILPIRIDNTNIVGLHNDVGHLDLNKEDVGSIVKTIIEKLKT